MQSSTTFLQAHSIYDCSYSPEISLMTLQFSTILGEFPSKTVPQIDSTTTPQDVQYHVVTKGHPTTEHQRGLLPERISATKAELNIC